MIINVWKREKEMAQLLQFYIGEFINLNFLLGGRKMEEVVYYGILSLIPAILAVVLAFWTKNVIVSLAISLFSGCLIIANWNPWIAMQDMFSAHLFVDFTGSSNAQTIIMMSFVGGFVALMDQSGGAKAFAGAIAKKVKSRAAAQVATWAGGLAIFFSDSGNSLILGPIFKPVYDRLKVSRAKLAYILDSTSSPVCILIPVTGWGVYIMSIIAAEFENLGIQASDSTTFLQAVPYQFYAILALLLVPLVASSNRDFGPMLKSERYTLENGPKESELAEETITVESSDNATAWHMIVPLIVLFATIFIMFISWGFPTQNVPGSKIRIALTSGYLLASIVMGAMIIRSKIMNFTEVIDCFISGVKKMAGILVIIILAWGVGSVCSMMGTSQFIVDQTIGFLSPALVPALLFLIGAVVSFATGTSWGTMAILLPLGINMAYSFEVSEVITIAAVLSGSLFGDHCAPISDTTVMSSMAAGCNHIEHVRTQIPYAVLAAVSAFIGYLIIGVTQSSAVVALPIAIVILVVLYFGAIKIFGKRTE